MQAGSQEAPAPVLTHSCCLLLFSVAVSGLPGEDWDRPCQGTRKAGCVAVVLTRVGTLISLSHQRQTNVKGDPLTLCTSAEKSFEVQVTSSSFVLFFFSEVL